MTRQEIETVKDWLDIGLKRLRTKLDAEGDVTSYKEVCQVQVSLDRILMRLLSEAVERRK